LWGIEGSGIDWNAGIVGAVPAGNSL